MNNLKKIFSILLSISFALSFCACRNLDGFNTESDSVSSDDKPTETANVIDESILNETETLPPSEADTSEPDETDVTESDGTNQPVESTHDAGSVSDDPETGTDEPENSPPPFSDPVDIPSSMELHNVGGMDYYLYIPANPSENMPLVIYLHGGTNKRGATPELLTTDGFPKYLYDGYFGDLRAYVAIPKLDDSYKDWAEAYVLIRNLVKSLSDNYAIDRSNIALTGHSMGGTGTYQLQLKLQDTFARIAPLSGSVQNSKSNLEALRKTRIWAFVGTADTIVDPQSSRDIVSALQSSGASARITELDGATHFDVPSLAYKDPELIRWLIEGNSCL